MERTILTGDGPESTLTITGAHVEVDHLTISHTGDGPAVTGEAVFTDCLRIQNGETSPLESEPVPYLPTWWVCGDSTSAICTPEWAPQTNWTQILPQYLQGRVHLQSYAKSGSSTKSFVAEGRLGAIELCLRPGDKLFMQFSHNDEKAPRELGTDARLTFPRYLDMYIDAARSHGAEPVIMTPFERRILDDAGNLTWSHRDYPKAARDLAMERGVRLLDMEIASRELFISTGLEEAKKYFMWLPANDPRYPNYPNGSQDNTHFIYEGAVALAELFRKLWNSSEEQRCSQDKLLF